LDQEPPDITDVKEVRHWIRVYSDMLEAAKRFPAQSPEAVMRRFVIWQQRLNFWKGRAREISNPSAR